MTREKQRLNSPPKVGDGLPVLRLVGESRTQAEVLHARIAPVVNRLVWSFLGVDAERDDLVHDIFVRILRSAHTVREPERLEEWAARVAVNCIKNEFRRRKLRRFFFLHSHADDEGQAYHADFEGRELLTRTSRILEQIPIDERIPLTLQLMQDSSIEEIAKICGSSGRTVKRRLKSARERFARLAKHDPLVHSRLVDGAAGGHS